MRSKVLGTLLALGLVTTMTPAAAFAAGLASTAAEAAGAGELEPMAPSASIDADTVATIRDTATGVVTQYKTLAEAVEDADGKTINLVKDCGEPVEVMRSIHFMINPGKFKFTGEITAPKEFTVSKRTTTDGLIDYTVMTPIQGDDKEEGDTIKPVEGVEAPETSVEVAKTAFPDGADWAIVASSIGFADAMSATGLAGTLDCPILITDSKKTTPAVLEEIERLGAKDVYLVGGTVALSKQVENDIVATGVNVGRIWGPDAWDTSVACNTKIVEHGGNPESHAIIATSKNFQDALSISSFAFKYKVPIFLTTSKNALPTAARTAITGMTGSVFVAGGGVVVPSTIAESAFGTTRTVRLAGSTGYDTSNEVAAYMLEKGYLSNKTACVASGAKVSRGLDALSGSALAGKTDAPILLVNGLLFDEKDKNYEPVNTVVIHGDDSEGTEAFVSHNAKELVKVYILGGENAVPSGVRNDIRKLIS